MAHHTVFKAIRIDIGHLTQFCAYLTLCLLIFFSWCLEVPLVAASASIPLLERSTRVSSHTALAQSAVRGSVYNADGTMRVVFWVGDMPESRIAYEQELIKDALEHTRSEYGEYTLELDRLIRSQERLARDLSSGEGIHILNGPGWSFLPPEGTTIDTTVIPIPLVKGLLGYRQCIIRRSDQARFAAIRTQDELKRFTMGLGQGWLDNTILEHNGYKVLGAPDLEKLYYMLKRGRFDCLPLGIGEAAGSLAEHDKDDELTIAQDLLMFYPLPVFMQVSGVDSPLARRMETGLRLMQQNGAFDQLFDEHYREKVQSMQSPNVRVFRLENPLLPQNLHHIGRDLIQHRR